MKKTVERASVAVRVALFALVVAVGAFAPIGAASASSGPQDVTINHCVGPGHIGTWSATGAITEAGASALLSRVIPGNSPHTNSPIIIPTIEFDGTNGSFVMTNTLHYYYTSDPDVFAFTGTWSIRSGTGDYAGLQGQGKNTGSVNADGTDFCTTYTGQLQLVGQ